VKGAFVCVSFLYEGADPSVVPQKTEARGCGPESRHQIEDTVCWKLLCQQARGDERVEDAPRAKMKLTARLEAGNQQATSLLVKVCPDTRVAKGRRMTLVRTQKPSLPGRGGRKLDPYPSWETGGLAACVSLLDQPWVTFRCSEVVEKWKLETLNLSEFGTGLIGADQP
jgi:hypothetical protein